MELFWIDFSTWILICIGLVTAKCIYWKWYHGTFQSLGIDGPKPGLLGNMDLFKTINMVDIDVELMKKYGKLYGFYFGRSPMLVVAEPALLKQILIKDFEHFQDRIYIPLRGGMRFSLLDARGSQWKFIRRELTPAFSSGKLKAMTQSILNVSDVLIDNLQEKCDKNEQFEAKEFAAAFTLDMLTVTTFGIEINSQKEPNNVFVREMKKFLNFSPGTGSWIMVFFLLLDFFIPVLDYFNVSILPKSINQLFVQFVDEAIKARKDKQTQSKVDFIQLILDANEEVEKEKQNTTEGGATAERKHGLTRDEIVGQCFVFFIAAYEATASAIAFLLYQLALNPEIQKKLVEELDQVTNGMDVTYDHLGQCEYLDMCINETLRLHTSLSRVDRTSQKDYDINGITVPKLVPVVIPMRGIHMDPENWPEPNKFDPERFTQEQKAKRDPMAFMPFGVGPRHCIGNRFALLVVKFAMINILRKFHIKTCEDTQIPIKYSNQFFLTPEKGLWLKVENRN